MFIKKFSENFKIMQKPIIRQMWSFLLYYLTSIGSLSSSAKASTNDILYQFLGIGRIPAVRDRISQENIESKNYVKTTFFGEWEDIVHILCCHCKVSEWVHELFT